MSNSGNSQTDENSFFTNLKEYEKNHEFNSGYNDLTTSNNQLDVENDERPYKQIQNTEKNKNKLNKILLTRNRMLEVNIQRNATKNKIIYSMFSFIILLIFIIVVIHYNIKN